MIEHHTLTREPQQPQEFHYLLFVHEYTVYSISKPIQEIDLPFKYFQLTLPVYIGSECGQKQTKI